MTKSKEIIAMENLAKEVIELENLAKEVIEMEKLIERARLAQLVGKPAVATECLRQARAIAEKLEQEAK